jgi:hypothetical protein
MSKVCENFEAKLIEYAAALREYNALHAEFHKRQYPSNVGNRLIAAGKRLDRLRGPMHTALDRLALDVA